MSTVDRNALDAWLGDTRADLTDEQYERLVDEAAEIATRHPGPDDDHERDEALSATVQWLLDETALVDFGRDLARARQAERAAFAAAQQAARLAALDGTPEAQAAREASVDRMTVRKALGKR